MGWRMNDFSRKDRLNRVKECIDTPALLEALAEESAELAQAALKLARYYRKENPTPKPFTELVANLVEEAGDVALCMEACGVEPLEVNVDAKLDRWLERLEGAANGQG